MTDTSLKLKINSLPRELRAQVADYVEFLKQKAKVKSNLKSREFGYAKGKITLTDDFDEPLDEFKNYM